MNLIGILSNLLLFMLIFGMTAGSSPESLKYHVQSKTGIFIGMGFQFVVLPFLAFISVKLFSLDRVIGTVLIIICSSPGGSYSNWWCSLINADLSLSVAMTGASTIFSVVFLPLNVAVYSFLAFSSDDSSLDWASIIVSLGVVLAGIGIGVLFAFNFSEQQVFDEENSEHNAREGVVSAQHKKNIILRACTLIGNLSGLALISMSFFLSSSNTKSPIWNRSASFYAGVSFPGLVALIFSFVTTACDKNLGKPERVAISIEVCYQNIGIATSVCLSIYTGDDQAAALGVPLYYGFASMVLLAVFCFTAFHKNWTYAPANTPLLKALSTSFQMVLTKQQNKELPELKA